MQEKSGLHHRFDLLLDDCSSALQLSPHFLTRLRVWRFGQGNQAAQEWHPCCYDDLEGLPCIVILAGKCRGGLRFPRYVAAANMLRPCLRQETCDVLYVCLMTVNGNKQCRRCPVILHNQCAHTFLYHLPGHYAMLIAGCALGGAFPGQPLRLT